MPDTAWAVNRLPPDSSRGRVIPRFRCHSYTFDTSSTVRSRSPSWLIPDGARCAAFSATLTTPALNRRSLRWFEASPCRATPEDLPPSLHSTAQSGPIFYIDPSFAFVAHITDITGGLR